VHAKQNNQNTSYHDARWGKAAHSVPGAVLEDGEKDAHEEFAATSRKEGCYHWREQDGDLFNGAVRVRAVPGSVKVCIRE
jgi:hypothetical protein